MQQIAHIINKSHIIKETLDGVIVQCPICLYKSEVKVSKIRLKLWLSHCRLIQDVLPNLDEQDRESLISGICGECWHND